MDTTKWYRQAEECQRENGTKTINEKSDILVCMKFNGGCGLVKCMDGHNGTNRSQNYEKQI